MNFEGKEELDRILEIEPNALTETDADFLRARRSYLTKEQSDVYADVLAEKPAKVEKAEKPAKE